jgi:hypothetical protein
MIKAVGKMIFSHIEIIVHLQSQPELGGHVEIFRQAQSRIGRDSSLSVYDFVYPPCRNPDVKGQFILTEIHRLEELFQ